MEMNITHLGYAIEYIDTEAKLKECVKQLNGVIGFDLEFDNNYYRYGFNLCLIQIATEKCCFVIDPIALNHKQLKPIFDVFENPNILKIAHSSGEDLRLLQLLGCRLQNLFDSDIAVKLLNYEKISLGNVVQEKLGVTLDKSLQISNWSLRPLEVKQIIYSVNDVIFLLPLKKLLEEELRNAHKLSWFQEEMAYITSVVFETEVKENFLSKADRKELGDFDQFVMNELYKYRDRISKKVGRASHRVMSGEALRVLINNPKNVDNWLNMKGFYHALKTVEIREEIKSVLNKALIEAQHQGLSKGKTVYRMSPSEYQEELEKRMEKQRIKEQVFSPIQSKIKELHGEFAATHLLSNVLANEIINKNITISTLLPYKQQLIYSTAQTVGVEVEGF
jgi:ribonuclease D